MERAPWYYDPADLEQVRRRLHQLVEERFVGGLDPTGQAEYEELSRREKELLGHEQR